MEPEDMIEEMLEVSDGEVEMIDDDEAVADTKLKPKSDREIESIVQDAISDAVDFVEGEISADRIKAQR